MRGMTLSDQALLSRSSASAAVISVVSTSDAGLNGAGATIVLPTPTGCAVGDVLVAAMSARSTLPTLPAGSAWAWLRTPAGGGSSDSGTLFAALTLPSGFASTWTFGNFSNNGTIVCIAIRNANPTVANDSIGSNTNTIPNVTPGVAGSIVICGAAVNSGSNANIPTYSWSALTSPVQRADGRTGASIGYVLNQGPGITSGLGTATPTFAGGRRLLTLAYNPI